MRYWVYLSRETQPGTLVRPRWIQTPAAHTPFSPSTWTNVAEALAFMGLLQVLDHKCYLPNSTLLTWRGQSASWGRGTLERGWKRVSRLTAASWLWEMLSGRWGTRRGRALTYHTEIPKLQGTFLISSLDTEIQLPNSICVKSEINPFFI